MAIRNTIRKRLVWGACGLTLIGALYVLLVAIGIIKLPFACMTDQKATIPNVAGLDFEITYMNCDTIAKEEAISVYASATGRLRESFFSKLLNRRSLLFRYDPYGYDTPLPTIRAATGNKIVISVPRVSQVLFQARRWRDVSIDYEIGHMDYP